MKNKEVWKQFNAGNGDMRNKTVFEALSRKYMVGFDFIFALEYREKVYKTFV